MFWQTTRFSIELSTPKVMGILNVTPDSFSDGGNHHSVKSAMAQAEQMLKDGAHILDVGGESSRPGAPVISLEEELFRVVPVLRELLKLGVPISVDTYKSGVMQTSLELGADIVNDIWALRQPGALALVASHPRCGLCLMHMHRDPQTMQVDPMQGDVLPEVSSFLQARCLALIELGVSPERVILDPGIGFGKTVEQNFILLERQSELLTLCYTLLAGWSRKSALGRVIDGDGPSTEPFERVAASVTAAVMALERGARVLRVHDVKETAHAIKVWQAVRDANMKAEELTASSV
jgi:dihydropteroate synthase